jgi:16S rRNA processing protein RimM
VPGSPPQIGTGIAVPADLVLVGHVAGAYGVGGWVKLRSYSAEAAALLQARTWWLDKPDLHDVDVLQVKRHGADVVAQLMGVAGRDAAEALKGATVQIRRSHFPALAADEFYWSDLIGLEVVNLRHESLGRVADLMDNGAHPILRVVPANDGGPVSAPASAPTPVSASAELLIPFVSRFILAVDLAAQSITVDWERDY